MLTDKRSGARISNSYRARLHDIARDYVEGNVTQAELARRMGLSESRVSRLLSAAREHKIIREVVVPYEDSTPSELPSQSDCDALASDLEARLRLAKAYVVPVAEHLAGKDQFDRGSDDRLAMELGAAAAKTLRGMIRHGDRVGVGPGRTIYFAVDALFGYGLEMPTVLPVSLAGGQPFYRFEDRGASSPSADLNTLALGQSLHTSNSLPTNAPAYWSPEERSSWRWERDAQPDIAIVGLGAMGPNIPTCFDQLIHEQNGAIRQQATCIRDAAEKLRQAFLSPGGSGGSESYTILADVLARPFVVMPPVTLAGDQANLFSDLEMRVASFAKLMRSPDDDEMREIDHVVLIAGGVRKAFPVLQYLSTQLKTSANPWCHSLVTDYWTARELVRISEACPIDDNAARAATIR